MTAHDGRKEGDDSHHEHRSHEGCDENGEKTTDGIVAGIAHEIAQGDVAAKGKHHNGNSQSGSAADTEYVRTRQGVAEGCLQEQAARGEGCARKQSGNRRRQSRFQQNIAVGFVGLRARNNRPHILPRDVYTPPCQVGEKQHDNGDCP